MSNRKSQIANHKSQKSWHHRMARLVAGGGYCPACQAGRCRIGGLRRAAAYVCEWDQQRGGKTVSGRKLYCTDHACNFAAKHNIYMADLPDVKLSDLETADRDDWKYSGEVKPRMNANGHESVESVKSVAQSEDVR